MRENKNELKYSAHEGIKNTEVKYIYVTNFDEKSLTDFYAKFIEIDTDPNIKVIPIVISSYGGQVFSLLGMLDIMKSTKKPVATIVLGKAMSCGAVLLSAGTPGYRYSGEHASILIHEVSSAEWGKSTDIQNGAAQTKKLNTKLMEILAVNAGQKPDFFTKMSKSRQNVDLYFSSAEAKKLGLVDFVSIPKFIKS